MNKKIIIVLILIFLLSSIGALVSFYITSDHDFFDDFTINEERKTSIENITMIDIEITSADLKFHLVDTDEIEVKLAGKITCFLCNVSNKFRFEEKNNVLNINSSFNSIGVFISTNLKMDIYLPKQFDKKLKINGVSSDIILKDLNLDELKVTSVSGDIILKNINVNNEVILKNTSGDIILDNLYADVNFNTVSGDLEVYKIYGNIIGNTTSGNVDIEILVNELNINIVTVSGDVEIGLDEDANFYFELNTVSGDIDIDFDYLVNNNSKNYKSGKVGNGDNYIKINTVSGDIDIEKIK